MFAAATADQVAEQVRQDFAWLRFARWLLHPDEGHQRRVRFWLRLLSPLTFVAGLVYAQILPLLLDKPLSRLVGQLPWIKDRQTLARIEDLLWLCHEVLSEMGRYSLARRKVAFWLEEIDEQLDTLEFLRTSGDELDSAIAAVRSYHVEHGAA